jgi:enoyl-CoA hydratase
MEKGGKDMDYQNFLWQREEAVVTVSVNRPDVLNSLDQATLEEMDRLLSAVEADRSIRALIVTGVGKAFVAGADIRSMRGFSPGEARAFSFLGQSVLHRLEQLPIPVVAAVNGFALGGGCELMLSADVRVASATARIGLPEVSLGLMPGFGGTQRLARLIGPGRAKELCFTGEAITAEEAWRIGLVNRVCAPEDLLAAANAVIASMLRNSPDGLRAAKRAVNLGLETDLMTGLALEAELFGSCFADENHAIGMEAFLRKGKPIFQDRKN